MKRRHLRLLAVALAIIAISVPIMAQATSPQYRVNCYEREESSPGCRECIVEVLWDQDTKRPTVIVAVYNQAAGVVRTENVPTGETWAMANIAIAEKGEYLKVMVVDPTTYAPLATAKTFGK